MPEELANGALQLNLELAAVKFHKPLRTNHDY